MKLNEAEAGLQNAEAAEKIKSEKSKADQTELILLRLLDHFGEGRFIGAYSFRPRVV